MANILTTNPIRVDTVMTQSYKTAVASTLGTGFTVLTKQIRWLAPIATGDVCLIIEPNSGMELLRLRAVAAGQDVVTDWSAFPQKWSDFRVAQLDSGRLTIYMV